MSWLEIFVIVIVALLVLGPKQLTALAKTTGRFYAKCENLISGVHQHVDQQMKLDELEQNQQRAEAVEKQQDQSSSQQKSK